MVLLHSSITYTLHTLFKEKRKNDWLNKSSKKNCFWNLLVYKEEDYVHKKWMQEIFSNTQSFLNKYSFADKKMTSWILMKYKIAKM